MSQHYPLLQSFGALLVLDADSRRIQAASSNFAATVGVPFRSEQMQTLAQTLGKRLSQRLRRGLHGQQRLAEPLTFTPPNSTTHFQLLAYRSAGHVVVEIEPLTPIDKPRLLGALNAQLLQLSDISQQEELLEYVVNAVQALSGYERVSICQFDSDWHGWVVAEANNGHLPSLLSYRFPANDFPLALRRAYERQPIRFVQDVLAPGVALEPETCPVALHDSFLRVPAPERQQYLQRLGARGSLSVAMSNDATLWGLLFCHSASPRSVPPAVRDAVRIVVQMATQRLLLLKARKEARFLQRVQDSLTLPTQQAGFEPPCPQGLFERQADTWRELFRAQGVALWVKGGIFQSGITPAPEVISQWVRRLEKAHAHSGPWCTRDIAKEPLTASLSMPGQCGALAVPLAVSSSQRGWLLFFRPEQVESVYAARLAAAKAQPMQTTSACHDDIVRKSAPWQRVERLAAMDLGEDVSLAISAHEIHTLNMHLEYERRALAEANQRLEQLAHFDPLTQVWNRYRIEQAIDAEFVAATRYGVCFAVLLFDVDHFKQINDTYGHSVGDEVLVALARLVESSLRGCDHLGRWGGEEFVVLATHSDVEAAVGLAERLRSLVATLHIDAIAQPVTVSVGVAAWRPGDSCKSLIARADKAMYRAKRSGRNRIEVALKETS